MWIQRHSVSKATEPEGNHPCDWNKMHHCFLPTLPTQTIAMISNVMTSIQFPKPDEAVLNLYG